MCLQLAIVPKTDGGGSIVMLSIEHEMLAEKYLRNPDGFASLVRVCRVYARRGCAYARADANKALDLLESLYAICREQEVAS